MGLDVNKENLIEQEIRDRLGRVEKVEMAKAIKVNQMSNNRKSSTYFVSSVPTASLTSVTLNIWSKRASVH